MTNKIDIPDSDGKDDFTEGVSYQTALNIAKGAEYESLEQLREARDKISFGDKVKLTWKGKTKVGRVAGTVLDLAELVAPSWAVRARDKVQSKTTDSTMKDIIGRVFTKSNGGFVRLWDELEGRDWKYYAAFAVRALIIIGLYFLADYLGIPLAKLIPAIFGT